MLLPRPRRVALACALAALMLVPASASAGNLVVTGHDADNHCGSSGLTVDTGPHCHFIHTVAQWVRSAAPDPTQKLLVVNCNSPYLPSALNAAYNGMPPTSDTVCPTDASFATLPIDTAHYSAMLVGTGVTALGSAGSLALNARKSDIEAFFNAGGGIFANTGVSLPTYYDFLPLTVGAGLNQAPYTLTADGITFGLQNAAQGVGTYDDINCCPTHNSFNEPAAGGALKVAERDANGKPITMFAQGQINGGSIVTATAPQTSIDATPDAHSSSDSATFAFSSTPVGATFECQVDGGAWSTCTSPVTLTGLAEGDHTFSVRGSANGLTDQTPATAAWNVALPKAQPAVDEPKTDPPSDPAPAPAPRISLVLPGDGAKSAVARTEVALRSNRSFDVGCHMEGALMRTCTVTAYVGSGSSARAVGQGTVTVDRAGHAKITVPLTLTAAGRRALSGADHGLSIRLKIAATPVGGSSAVTSQRKVLLRPKRQRIVRGLGEFSPNSAVLRADTVDYLQSLRTVVATAKSVTCTGHTASVSGHAAADANARLGLRRATAVCSFLAHNGFKGRTIVRTQAGTRPRATNQTARGRGLNRRVELLVVR